MHGVLGKRLVSLLFKLNTLLLLLITHQLVMQLIIYFLRRLLMVNIIQCVLKLSIKVIEWRCVNA